MNVQNIPNGTRVLIQAKHPWGNHSGEVVNFYPSNPVGVCYVVRLDNGCEAGAKESELRVLQGPRR